ncbi:ParA family protein [Saccharothrix obliqua]|uniref:ParA family protein n=1 Tax=Saccharothrix obliqua TaxID=2861747 RepID=UPI001C5FBC07|nr:ParA family protein [Saccharothrix obliqua]MBW4722411.1 ParA family protein [Saccharothrix obliqua]
MQTFEVEEAPLFELVPAMRAHFRTALAGKILAVESDKGGLGKTTIAVELAYNLDAVLVDADWHDGNAARSLGWRHETRAQSPMLRAIEGGFVPRPISGGTMRPDLVAAGPELEHNQPPASVMADALTAWAASYGRPIVVDTHPGGGEAANGAAEAAHAVVTPVPLRQKELDALAGWVRLMAGYPLIVVPNMVPRVPPAGQLDYLEKIAKEHDLPVTSPVPHAVAIERRRARTAVSSMSLWGEGKIGPRYEPFIRAMLAVTTEVADRVG